MCVISFPPFIPNLWGYSSPSLEAGAEIVKIRNVICMKFPEFAGLEVFFAVLDSFSLLGFLGLPDVFCFFFFFEWYWVLSGLFI